MDNHEDDSIFPSIDGDGLSALNIHHFKAFHPQRGRRRILCRRISNVCGLFQSGYSQRKQSSISSKQQQPKQRWRVSQKTFFRSFFFLELVRERQKKSETSKRHQAVSDQRTKKMCRHESSIQRICLFFSIKTNFCLWKWNGHDQRKNK